jgi:hypothetical protein
MARLNPVDFEIRNVAAGNRVIVPAPIPFPAAARDPLRAPVSSSEFSVTGRKDLTR